MMQKMWVMHLMEVDGDDDDDDDEDEDDSLM